MRHPIPTEAFWRPGMPLTVQSVLYGTDPAGLERALESLSNAAEHAVAAGLIEKVTLAYGDGSPDPVLTPDILEDWRRKYPGVADIRYEFFGANLGSARGHNTLMGLGVSPKTGGFLLVMNPDVLLAPDALINLLTRMKEPGIGLVEGRQMPVEHPKEYDRTTGDTCWASTACALIDQDFFHHLGGFDADTFFLYCDDVDFSWRVRLAGYRVVFEPSAVVFHDKRLSNTAGWIPSSAERYYSAEAALMLAYKYSRPDLLEMISSSFTMSGNEVLLRALEEFNRRKTENRLPTPLDAYHQVATFIDGEYAAHRFRI